MGTSLQNTKIKDTYEGLIKTTDNSTVGSSDKELTDGAGNDLNISVNNTGDITADGDVTAASLIKTGGTALQILLADGTTITLTRESDAIGSNDSDSNVPSNAAVKDYVDTEITNLIDSAPTALDTLNELAAALGDDANFSTTITTALGNRLRFDASQSLTSGEVTQALTNLGITATVAEINFIDGLTSNIQTQIDSKYDKTGGTISGDATITGDLTVDTSTLYVDSTNNRVGIGTTSPATKLDVIGSSGLLGRFGNDNNPYYIQIGGVRSMFGYDGTNAIIQGGITKGIAFYTGGSTFADSTLERMRIDSSGNFGFNETPENSNGTWRNFEVGGINIVSRFTGNNDGFFGTGYVFKTDNSEVYKNTEAVSRVFFNNDTIEFQQASSGTAGTAISWDIPLKIDSSGNVGIGTTSPNAELDIRSDSTSNTSIKIENSSTGGDAFQLMSTGSGASFGAGVFSIYSNDNASHRFVINSSGNVGIGTTSPNASGSRKTLHIEDSDGAAIRLADDGVSSLIRYDNTNGLSIGTVGSNNVVLSTSDTERMRINSSGNVGIGTTSPLVKTQISTNLSSGSVQDALLLSQNTATSSSGQGVKMYLSSSNSIIRAAAIEAIAGSSNDHSLGFYTNSAFAPPAERMRIDSSGRLGLGTTSPSAKLDIDDGSVTDIRIRGNATSNTRIGGVAWYNTAASDVIAAINVDRDSANDAGAITFDTQSSGGSNTERMRIDSSGRVGIGTTSPSSILHLEGGGGNDKQLRLATSPSTYWDIGRSNQSGHFEITEDTGDTYFLINNSNGNVGIGTTSPNERLHLNVGDSGTNYLQFTNSTTGTGSTDGMLVGLGNGEEATIWQFENDYMRFGTNNTERMRIDSSGNVGIGTTSPSEKLSIQSGNVDINGVSSYPLLKIRASGLTSSVFTITQDTANPKFSVSDARDFIFESNSQERMRIDSSGQVKFNNYTSSSAFTGTAAANLAVDSSGNIITEAAAAVITWQSTAKTSSFTASSNEGYFVDTSSSAITITFPSAPSVGDLLAFTDFSSSFATNNVTLTSSKKILGADDDFLLDSNNQAIELVFSGDTKGWLISSAANEGTEAVSAAPVEIDFLVVAGGGGGGRARVTIDSIMNISGGGGGAGEFLHLTGQEIELNENHNVTVGAGGAYETNGSDSRFLTTGNQSTSFDYTCSGGGYGGRRQLTGNDGGSGGGGAGTYSSSYTAGGDSVKNEAAFGSLGNDGGNGNHVNGARGAGGGGGAGAAGSNQSGGTGGDGGNGYASDITGTSVTYAGGGSGGGEGTANGTAGTGGGGAHSNGTANTGGGGGGASWNNSSGRSGGSGIVIIKYPDTLTLTVGSNLTSSTDTSVSGFKITTFTAGADTISWS